MKQLIQFFVYFEIASVSYGYLESQKDDNQFAEMSAEYER